MPKTLTCRDDNRLTLMLCYENSVSITLFVFFFFFFGGVTFGHLDRSAMGPFVEDLSASHIMWVVGGFIRFVSADSKIRRESRVRVVPSIYGLVMTQSKGWMNIFSFNSNYLGRIFIFWSNYWWMLLSRLN